MVNEADLDARLLETSMVLRAHFDPSRQALHAGSRAELSRIGINPLSGVSEGDENLVTGV